MKTINLNKKSWHFWIATTLGIFRPDSGDFCKYVRNVIGGSIFGLMIAAAVGFVVAVLGGGLINIAIYLYDILTGHPYTITNPVMQAGSIILLVSIVMVGIGFIVAYVKGKIEEHKYATSGVDQPDSFVANAYKSIKNKVCFKVNFKE